MAEERGDHSRRGHVERRPRLLADALMITLSRLGYSLLDLTGQPEPRVLIELGPLDHHSDVQARPRMVIELSGEPNESARVRVDGVEVATPVTRLTDLETVLRRLAGQP